MKIKTSKNERAALIKSLSPEQFETYEDYFLAIHLNKNVALMHTFGFVVGLIILPFALYYLHWYLFIVYFFFFYGLGFLSHKIFDGVISRTAKEAPWKSFIYAVKVNLTFMLGKLPQLEQTLFAKYPFLIKVYYKGH